MAENEGSVILDVVSEVAFVMKLLSQNNTILRCKANEFNSTLCKIEALNLWSSGKLFYKII
jgi:hypothetical protein